MKIKSVMGAAALFLSLAALPVAASAAELVDAVRLGDSSVGKVLVDSKGMTLYTFDKDPMGKSVCNGKCAENWPPLLASAQAQATGEFSVITRDDGKKQWAYKGKPLYLWVKDAKAGDATGDKVNNVWAAARP